MTTTKPPAVSECWLVPQAAEQLGVNRSTLVSAINRGDLPTHKTACGRDTVLLADCQTFLNNSPGRGFCDPNTREKAQKSLSKARKKAAKTR